MSNYQKYDWEKIFDPNRKKPFKFRHKKNFHCMIHSMTSQVRNAAHRMGVSITIKFDPNGTDFSVKVLKSRKKAIG